MKKSGFNFFSNLLVFTANQTWQLVIENVKYETLYCWSSLFDRIVQQCLFAFNMVSEGGRGSFARCMLSIQRNTFLTSSVNPRTDALIFLCVCLQTLGQITFAHNFLLRTDFSTSASLRTVMRCFINLDQFDGLTQNDSIKRLALPNIDCLWSE